MKSLPNKNEHNIIPIKIKVLLVIILSSAVSVILILLNRSHMSEPQYKGKSASLWFQEMHPLKPSPGMEALNKMGKEALPLLKEALKDGTPNNRYKAAWALGQMGSTVGDDIVPPLLEAMQDTNNSVRFYAVDSLSKAGSRNANIVPALLNALGDSNKSVSANAAKFLNTIEQDRKAKNLPPPFTNEVEYAMCFLRSTSPQVRLMGLDRLGGLPGAPPEVSEILKACLKDPNQTIRAQAKLYLADNGSSSSK